MVALHWIRADWIEFLTDINPWFYRGQLRVSSKVQGKSTSADQVADSLLHVFRLVSFCETRLLGALSVGLYELALLALDLKGAPKPSCMVSRDYPTTPSGTRQSGPLQHSSRRLSPNWCQRTIG